MVDPGLRAQIVNHSFVSSAALLFPVLSPFDRWRDSFLNFFENMGERYEGLTLERIDTNGNCEPDNCEWDTRLRQARNTRRNVWLEYNGIKGLSYHWAQMFDVNPGFLYHKLNRDSANFQEIVQEIQTNHLEDAVDSALKLPVVHYKHGSYRI